MFPFNIQASLRQALEKARVKFPGMIMSLNQIRIEQTLAAAQNNYNFIMKDPGSQPADGSIQIRLNDNDAFVSVAAALCVRKFTTANPGYFPLMTYPDPSYFTGGSNTQSDALECVYGGSLAFKTASTVRIDSIGTSVFRYAPNSQYKVPTSNVPVTPFTTPNYSPGRVWPEYGPNYEAKGFVDLVNYPIIDGSEQNVWSLQLGTGALTNVGTDVNVCLLQMGILIKGAGASAKRWQWLDQ